MENTRRTYKILAAITTLVLIISMIQPLGLFQPLWANDAAIPIIDEDNHFSFTFGWAGSPVEGGTVSRSLSFNDYNSRQSICTTRMVYNASGYSGEYASGALNITVKSPFWVYAMGADTSESGSRYAFYQKSRDYDDATGIYTYVFSNHNALTGDVFDGYIDVTWGSNLNTLGKVRGISDIYDLQEWKDKFTEPFTISGALTSETNNINLSADDIYVKVDPMQTYKYVMFDTRYNPRVQYSPTVVDKKVGLEYYMQLSNSTGWFPAEYTDYIALLPEYADISATEGYEELPINHPFYQQYQKNYSDRKAYIHTVKKMETRDNKINVLYPTEYRNTDQTMSLFIFNYLDEERAQLLYSSSRTATGHIGDIVTEKPNTDEHSAYPNLYTYSYAENIGVFNPLQDDYETPLNFEMLQKEGLYQNANLYEAIAPQQYFFSGYDDSYDIPDADFSIITINDELQDISVIKSRGTTVKSDDAQTSVTVLAEQDYENLSEEQKSAFDANNDNKLITNNRWTTGENLSVFDNESGEIKHIEYSASDDEQLSLSLIKIASNLTEEQAAVLYASAVDAKEQGSTQAVLNAYFYNTSGIRSTAMNSLFYMPIYNFYIQEDEGSFSLVAETATPAPEAEQSVWNTKTPSFCGDPDCVLHTYSSPFIPAYAIISDKNIIDGTVLNGISQLAYEPIQAGENCSANLNDEEICSFPSYLNSILRPNGIAFKDGYTSEFYTDFNDVDLKFGELEPLTEDDFEYTYVRAPGRALVHLSPKQVNANALVNYDINNDTDWKLYIRARGEAEEQLFAEASDGKYSAGDIIPLPENTVSVRMSVYKSPKILESARELSSTWVASYDMFDITPWGYEATKTGYGIRIYPETMQRAESSGRYSLTATSYASVASWCVNDDNNYFSNDRVIHRNQERNPNTLQPTSDREMQKYGEYKKTHSITNSFMRETALAKATLNYSEDSLISSTLTKNAYISGYITFSAKDSVNFEEGLIDKNSDNIYKLSRADNYVLISKSLGFLPTDVELTPEGHYIPNSTRSAVGNDGNYLKSHSSIDILDGDDYGYPGNLIVRIDNNFTDDPLTNSYATGSPSISINFKITGTMDAVVGTEQSLIKILSFIDGGEEGTSYSYYNIAYDENDLNGNNDTSEYMLYSFVNTPKSDPSSMAGHRTVLLEEKSSATYDMYKIGAGKASAGEDFETKLTITTAANVLKNIVIYDYFWDSNLDSDWNPTLKSIDIPNPEQYTVYYSTYTNPGAYGEDLSWAEYDEDIITPEQKASIKSIAIVFNSDYAIPDRSTVEFPITFTAPVMEDGIGKTFKNTNVFVSSSYNTEGVQTGLEASLESNEADIELVLDKTLIAIRLRDADTLTPIQGGTFSIYSAADDSLVSADAFATASDGLTTAIKLPIGKYYAVQTNTIEGYLHQQTQYPFSVSLALLSKDINIVDTYNKRASVDVVLHKKDAVSGKPLSGASFILTDVNDPNTKYNTSVSNEEGNINITLPWGDYYLNEYRIPLGYQSISQMLITIPASGAESGFEMDIPDPRGDTKVTLTAASAADKEVIPGAIYDLFKANGTKVGTYTTNESGQISIPSLEWDEYYFTSVNDPDGYDKNDGQIDFTIDENHLVVELTDLLGRHLGTVKLIKSDANDPSHTLKGAVYSLYDVDGYKYRTNLVTDDNGEVLVEDLPWGSYYFAEESAPFGYSLSDKKTIININKYTASQVQSIAVTDSSTSGSIMITKKVKTDDVNFDVENPTFVFKVTGSVNGISKYSYYTSVTFDELSLVDNGYYVETALMSDLPQCEWKVEEQDVIRYAASEISTSIDAAVDPDNNVTISGASVQFELTAKTLNANIIYTNERLYKEGFSSIDAIVNTFNSESTVVGIVAKTAEPSYAPNTPITLDDILLSFLKDDGTEVRIDPQDINVPSGQTPAGDKIEVSEINTQYSQPGTYIYPLTITINDKTVYETIVKIEISEFVYEKIDDTTISITGYRGNKETVVIPQTIDGYTVTQIGQVNYEGDSCASNYSNSGKVVLGNEYPKKIVLPSTIKVISNGAFGYGSKFTNLEEIVIPSGAHLTDICPYAFYLYPNSGLSLNSDSFVLTIEDNAVVDNLHSYAFYNFPNSYQSGKGPRTVDLNIEGNSYIKRYHPYSLYGITMEEVNFTEGTEVIGSYVFYCDNAIKRVILPYSLKFIADYGLDCSSSHVDTIVFKSINAVLSEYSLGNSNNVNLIVPFYTASVMGLTAGNTRERTPAGDFQNLNIKEDISILDGIDWEYTDPNKAVLYDSYIFNYVSSQDYEKVNTALNARDAIVLERWNGSEEMTLPDKIESIYAKSNSGNIHISENSELKEFDYVYGNYGNSQFKFYDDIVPDSVEIYNTMMPTEQYGSFTANSKLKYMFNSGMGTGLIANQSIIPKELKAANLMYSPQNNSTIQFNPSDLKMAVSIYPYSGNGYYSRSLINYLLRYNSNYESIDINNVNIIIEDNVTNIPAYSFANYKGFLQYSPLSLEDDLSRVHKNYDVYVSCGSIKIPQSTLHIGARAFENVSLKQITINEGVKAIEDRAFYSSYIKRINSFGIKNEIIYLDYNLQGVNGNGKLVLPDSLEYLGSSVFGPSDSISEIHIGKNLQHISSDFIDVSKYPALTKITVNENNPYFVCTDGQTIYNKDMSRIVFTIDSSKAVGPVINETNHFVVNGTELVDVVNPDTTSIILPENIKKIGIGAMEGINTTSVVLPSSLTEIADYAFYNSVINSINIPHSVTSIGDWAFSSSDAFNDLVVSLRNDLKSTAKEEVHTQEAISRMTSPDYQINVTFEDESALKEIGKGAFMSKNVAFSGTKIFNVPSSIVTIDDFAFANCRSIEKVVFKEDSKLENINFASFMGVGSDISRTVIDLEQKYSAEGFYQPAFSQLPSSVKSIEDFAFYETQFESYNFENLHNLTYIGSYAFSEHADRRMASSSESETTKNLRDTKHIVIPENVKYIGYNAFAQTRANMRYENTCERVNYVSSVYIKSPNIEIASVDTFGTRIYSYAAYNLNGNSKNSYDNKIMNRITIYGNSDNVKAFADKYGYKYVSYVETTNKSGFSYEELVDGTLEITGVNPDINIKNNVLVVPSTINGKAVQAIASAAFDSPITYGTVKKLIVEDGIKKIGSDLFMDHGVIAERLHDIYDGSNGYPSMGTWYTDSKSYYKDFDDPKDGMASAYLLSASKGNSIVRMFRPSLIKAILPQSVISIGSPFRGCQCTDNIDSLTNINELTSNYMTTSSSRIVLGEGVTEIPSYWGNGLTSTTVVLPSTLEKIGNYGLYNTTPDFSNNPHIKYLADYAIGSKTMNANPEIVAALEYLGNNNNPTIFAENGVLDLKSVKEIAPEALQRITLSELKLGDSIKTIPSSVFNYSTIGKLKIPDSVEVIEAGNYYDITELILPESTYSIEEGIISFNYRGTVKNLENAESITGIIRYYPMDTLEINADRVSYISDASNLTSITFTSKELKIAVPKATYQPLGFSGCSKLSDIYFYDPDAPTLEEDSSGRLSKYLYSVPENTVIHIPAGSNDAYMAWFKDQYYGSETTTIADAVKSGKIVLKEDTE